MFQNKIVIPNSSRLEILHKLHKAHFGIEKTKPRARKVLYWPGITGDIEKFISKCKICEKFSKANTKEPLISHEVPDYPFQKVAADILYYKGEDYLVLIDYYSNWIELYKLYNKTADSIIEVLKHIFSLQSIPMFFMSDNMS